MPKSIDEIEWKVSDDRLSVFVRFPEPLESPFPPEAFDELLEKHGIVVSCDSRTFLSAQESGSGEWVPVAFGTPPKPGRDARIEYYVNPSLVESTQKETKEGRVDYKNLQKILNVEKGQELARKHDPVPGEPGKDVYGNTIEPEEPKNFPIPVGQGIELVEDGHLAVASEDGAISTQGQRISVIRVYPISGNISYRTGNISFKGTVDISGDVQTGFEVHADGDILVKGLVEGAILEAGKDIIILGGFQGAGKGRLRAGGTIKVRFANEGVLEAGEDIVVDVHLLNCEARAKGAIRLTGPKGVIAGGDVRAGESISAAYLGTELGVKTPLQIGLSDDLFEEIQTTEKTIEETTERLAQVEELLMTLEKIKSAEGSLSKEKEDIRIRAVREQFAIMGELGKRNKLLVELKQAQEAARNGTVVAGVLSYPGVLVRFPGDVLTVKNEIKYTTFYFERGEVRTRAN